MPIVANLEVVFEVSCVMSVVGTLVIALGEVMSDSSNVGSTDDLPDGDNENK